MCSFGLQQFNVINVLKIIYLVFTFLKTSEIIKLKSEIRNGKKRTSELRDSQT